jgi:AraC family transcriptional regulator, melibiose operon regulatory protein
MAETGEEELDTVSAPSEAAPVQQLASKLMCWQGRGMAMTAAHCHDDLEVNIVDGASLTYLSGGNLVEIKPGQAAVFWAAIPHRLIDCPHNWAARVRWLHVPVSTALGWALPRAAFASLLRGNPLVTADVEYPASTDVARWSGDLASGYAARREIALLEIQAAVRRLVLQATPPHPRPAVDDRVRHVATMARFAATHYREPISTADIAESAGLHPNYAMNLFRSVLGTTLHAYLTQRRVAEAQRLLLTTPATTDQVAIASGFGSQSAFYACFTRRSGVPPGEYRRTRGELGPVRAESTRINEHQSM